MRKIFLYLIAYLCFTYPAYAAPCYGTKLPERNHFFAGLQTYAISERSLEQDHGKISSLQNFFLVSYGLMDWISIDLKGGAGNEKQHLTTGDDLSYPTYVGGGYGFRVKLYDAHETKFVFGFQHISIHPHTISINDSKHKAVLDNWQFSFLVSHDFFGITPYIGTRWSRMDNIHWINTERNLEKSDTGKSIGLIIGTDIPINKKLWINLESQFLDEKSLSGSINFAF